MSTTDTRAAFEALLEEYKTVLSSAYCQCDYDEELVANAEAAIASLAAIEATKPAAQDSAQAELPTTTIERWQDRLRLCPSREELMAAMQSEIDDWRAAAPIYPQPEKPDWSQFKEWLAREMPAGTVIGDPAWWAPRIFNAVGFKTIPQPVAKVLTDEQLEDIRHAACILDNEGYTTQSQDLYAIHAAASTPTTLTEKK